MNITLYKSEIATVTDKPFNSLSLAEKRSVAARVLRNRPGNWSWEIRLLQSGIPAANKFIVMDEIATR